MDELIAYLEKRFSETSQQIQQLRDEMHQEISGLGQGLRQEMAQEISGLRQEMTQEISGLRQEMTQEISGLRQEMNERFTGVQEEIRHTGVQIEAMDSELRLLAEGVIGMGEKMDTLRADVTKELKDTRSLVQDSYISLERRVHTLETWRETKERDPLDIIRERFGKRPQT